MTNEFDFQENIYDAIDFCETVTQTPTQPIPFSVTSTKIGTETFNITISPSSAIVFLEAGGLDPTKNFSLSGSLLTVNDIRRIGDEIYGYLNV